MTQHYSVSQAWGLVLHDLGVDPERVLRRARQPLDLFARGPVRVEPEAYHALWLALAAETEGCLPLRFARVLRIEAFDPALFAAVCSADLHAAVLRIGEFKPLVGPMRLEVDATEDALSLRVVWPAGLEPPAVLGFSELLFWVALARLCTRHPLRPLAFTAPVLPHLRSEYQDYLGVQPTLGPDWGVTFTRADAQRPFLTMNEGMWAFFEPGLRERLARLQQDATVSERVKAALLELLPQGSGSADAVARSLAVSRRTLQRRLKDEGQSFQRILSQTRESLARHYLTQSQLPSAEISFLLGYEDPNSFIRAFHTWTGTTPEAHRSATG